MKKILAFSGSNSSSSINTLLTHHAASLVKNNNVTEIDLRDFPLPIYSSDIEKNDGIPENAAKLKQLISKYDGYIISLPEHNSSLTAFFKNTIDWVSRVEMKFLNGKPIALLSTSPGPGGGKNGLTQAEPILTGYLTGNVIGKLSLAKFYDNVEQNENKITLKNANQKKDLEALIKQLEIAL